MTLIPTQTAPALDLALVGWGTTDDLKLGTGEGGRFSLIVFFRGLHCPICRKQMAEIDKRIEDLKAAGIGQVVAVSMETLERSTRIVDEWHLASLRVAYGLEEEAARMWGLNLSHAIKDASRTCSTNQASSSSMRTAPCSGPARPPCPSADRPWMT